MKVLLVTVPMSERSYDSGSVSRPEPLALEYLGAGIRQNHDVKVVDMAVEGAPSLKDVLASYQPDIIGCGPVTAEVFPARELFAEAKKLIPKILTVVGGHHATVQPNDFFEENIDVVLTGEGVHTFRKLCDAHEKGKGFAGIKNIYFRQDGKMAFTSKEEYPSLDSLPFPDRSLLSESRHHYTTHLLYKAMPMASVRSSVGCYYRCNFCAVSNMLNRKVHTRKIDGIIEELSTLEQPVILWVDDEFFLDTKRAVTIAREIDKAGIRKNYLICGRSDTIVNHPETIEEWAKIGLKYLFVGLEAFREEDLKKMQKSNTLAKNEELVRIAHANGVKVRGLFIVQPDFDRKDFKELGQYARKLKIDIPTYSVSTPVPGTELYEEKKNDLMTHDYRLYDMMHTVLPTKLPLKKFYREYSNLMFKRGITFREKIKYFRQIDKEERMKFFRNGMNLYKKLRDAHKLYAD